MPRGKYVNHKGRNRHFTSPEELQRDLDSDEESSSGDDEKAAGTSSNAAKSRARAGKMPTSSEESSDEEIDRDAKKGVASLIEIENPNRAVKKATVKVEAISFDETERELNRREREQLEKEKAKKRYEKLHAAGKTAQAKADLARLALIKEQRQQAAAKREAEKLALAEKNTTSKA